MNRSRYQPPSEIRIIKELGGDVVGVTACSEGSRDRQRGFLSREKFVAVMAKRGSKILKILLNLNEMGLADSPSALEA